MNIPETQLCQLIDNLTLRSVSFALYRLPWTDEPILVLQEGGDVEKLDSLNELNGKRGFVLTIRTCASWCADSSGQGCKRLGADRRGVG